jgi:hypothetical protein
MTKSYSVEIGESMSEEVNQRQREEIVSGTDTSTPGIADPFESARRANVMVGPSLLVSLLKQGGP